MKRTLSLILTAALVLSLMSFQLSSAAPASHLIINQAYGRADKADAAISHCFVELYNPTDAAVDISGYSLQYADTGAAWQKLDLAGSIPAGHSYLIRGGTLDGLSTRYAIPDFDISWDRLFSNDLFKIALVENKTALSVVNPTAADGVIDLLGAGAKIDYAETKAIDGISKQKTARRIAFSDTDNNSVDFEVLDYRASGISDARLAEVRPRSLKDGAWSSDAEPPIPSERELMFSIPAGLYTSQQSLVLSTDFKDAFVRYTLDGSTPTAQSAVYEAPLTIKDRTSDPNVLSAIRNISSSGNETPPAANVSKGTVVKAAAFSSSGKMLSSVKTNTYFVFSNAFSKYKLPIISLSTDRANFFDSTTGIYMRPNFENSGAEWERPVYIEIFEEDGTPVVSQGMGTRIHGGWTRRIPQKSLRLYAKKGYDADHPALDYDIFKGTAKDIYGDPITSFRRIILRNSGNDNPSSFATATMLRDGMMQRLVEDLNMDTQAYRPSALFLNGEFWGLYNIRERYDNEYIGATYRISDINKVAMLELNMDCNNIPEIGEGDASDVAAYNEMYSFFSGNSLASQENYEKALTYIDEDNFIDYFASEIYFDNTDWPGNNVVIWRYKTDALNPGAPYGQDGRWRWMLKDTDYGFRNLYSNTLNWATSTVGVNGNAPWSTLMFRKLLENDTFKAKFINRLCGIMNTNFNPAYVASEVNAMRSAVETIIPEQFARWRGNPSNLSAWNTQVNGLVNFANGRAAVVRANLAGKFGLQSAQTVTTSADPEMGFISLNGIDIASGTKGVADPKNWSGYYFQGTAQTFKAVPNEGFRFVRFIVTSGSGQPASDYDGTITRNVPGGGMKVEAVFEAVPVNKAPVIERVDVVDEVTGPTCIVRRFVPVVSDDGLPGGALTYKWDVISSPEICAFDPDAESTFISIIASGIYKIKLEVSDGELSSEYIFDYIATEDMFTDGVTSTENLTGADIVSGYAANLILRIKGRNIAGEKITIVMEAPEPITQTVTAPSDDFTAALRIPKAPSAGEYLVYAHMGEAFVSSSSIITVVPRDDAIWTVGLSRDGGNTLASFRRAISPGAGGYEVSVNSAAKAVAAGSGNTLIISHAAQPGDVFKISKVRYADLFPSYTFTFTVTFPSSPA